MTEITLRLSCDEPGCEHSYELRRWFKGKLDYFDRTLRLEASKAGGGCAQKKDTEKIGDYCPTCFVTIDFDDPVGTVRPSKRTAILFALSVLANLALVAYLIYRM